MVWFSRIPSSNKLIPLPKPQECNASACIQEHQRLMTKILSYIQILTVSDLYFERYSITEFQELHQYELM